VDDLWAAKSKDVGLIARAVSFQDFQPMWSWSTNVCDGQTDGQTTCDSKTALCTVVHRAVKIKCYNGNSGGTCPHARRLATPMRFSAHTCIKRFFYVFTARGYASSVVYAVVMCLSVCQSVTFRCSVKTTKLRTMQTVPHHSPWILIF